jgi:hypothetical protein
MKYQRATLACVVFFVAFARPTAAQELGPNAPHYVKSVKAPGLDVRYLDFKWDEEAFNTLEKGGSHPVGRRSWVLARLLTTLNPFRCEGKIMPVGPSLLILNPARPGAGPTLELRYIDLREVFVNMNVIAEPPAGETYCKVPAVFRKVDKKAERLELTLTEGKGSIDVVTHYGDRETHIALVRD